MIIEIHIRPEAEKDLSDAATWYESQRPGLGYQFLEEVSAIFLKISENPLIYPNIHRNIRRALIRRFPFGVYYQVKDSAVIIFAVMHGSRNPRNWKSRT
ncbi:MAG: type II toxin-antitoxin system RelE/ParE family toxin [Firmicutes bacterium]|nr:type II toxin-antitoxin system RelE/ParE family toxin [Bacillota bacterium]